MSLRQTIQEIGALNRQITDQLRIIDDFLKQNRDHMALVRNELQGTKKAYDQLMLQSLDGAEKALNRSTAALLQASEALVRVQAI